MGMDVTSTALQRFIAASPIPMTLSSVDAPDCPLLLANDAFLKLTGYTRDAVIGRNCRFLQGPESEPVSISRMREAIAAGTQVMLPVRNYRADGSPFDNLVFLYPVLSDSGRPLYIMGSQYDVTAPRRHVSLAEHAEILDERIAVAGPAMRASESLVLPPAEPFSRRLADLPAGPRR